MPAKVTIGVPVYRGKLFIEDSLASLLNQTYQDFEVMISIDETDPETEAICSKFLSDPRFNMFVQSHRLGWMDNTNWLMSRAQGEFWHLQEQDDIIAPTFLETLIEYTTQNPHVVAAYFDVRLFGQLSHSITMSSVVGSAFARQIKLLYEHFQGVAPLGLIRTEALRGAGWLRGNDIDNFAADTSLMAALARFGELHRIPTDHYRKRIHENNTVGTWFTWPKEKRYAAWQCHCVNMLEQAFQIEIGPLEGRLLWLATIERLVSPRTAIWFIDVANLTAADRMLMLDSFFERARASKFLDIPRLLDFNWGQLNQWTKDFYSIGP